MVEAIAYQLFEFYYADDQFEITNEDAAYEQIDMADFKLHQLELQLGEGIRKKSADHFFKRWSISPKLLNFLPRK